MNEFNTVLDKIEVSFNPHGAQHTTTYTNITGRELLGKLKIPRIGDKDGSHFLRTSLKHNTDGKYLSRGDDHCTQEAWLIIIDVDKATASPQTVHEALKQADIAHIITGTHSYYAKDENRFRILLLSNEAYRKDQLEPTSEAVIETINCFLTTGFVEYAKENKKYSQPWFTPSMPQDCEKTVLYLEYTEGQLFQVRNKQAPQNISQAPSRSLSLKQGQISPITEWNNQFPVEYVLQEHGYKLVLRNNQSYRWLSPDSTSGQGGVIEDRTTGKVFSHHNDCLNDGYAHDSFDVMRLLKGLSFEDAVKFASKHTKAPDGRTIDEYHKHLLRKNKPAENKAPSQISFEAYQPFNNELLPVENVPYDALPDILGDFIKEQSLIRGCSDDYILVSLLARMGCVFSGKMQIALTRKTGWCASPNFFWAMIGDPSSGKSNALSAINKPIQLLSENARIKYKKEIEEYLHSLALIESKISTAKKGMEAEGKKAKAKPDVVTKFENSFKANMQELAELEEQKPKQKRYTVTKTTIEKLILILEENPEGIMLEVDELSSSFVRLSKDEHADERGLYLSGFNGGIQYPYDTVKRGTVFIQRLLLSIFGGIQPSRLKRFLNEARTGFQDDGMLQRFQGVVYPDKNTRKLEDKQASIFLINRIDELFSNLDCLPADTILRLDDTAQELFDEWRHETTEIAQALGHPYEAHLVKSYEFVASLAVYLYLAENNGKLTFDKQVSTKQILSAIKLGTYFFSHAKRMYGLVYKDNLPARSLSEKLAKLVCANTAKNEHYDSVMKLYFFSRSQIRSKDWADLTTKEERREAIIALIKFGYISKPHGNKYYINPDYLNE
ncbi:MAG: DUF3987 domain-containing protein [Legionellaceae bacterium]|nr:DUF3987 domain-containing protein [Legionellaceae bacterium]